MDTKIISVLPKLDSTTEEEVNNWYNDIDNVMRLFNITEAEKQYRLSLISAEGEPKTIINELGKKRSKFPTLPDIRKALLEKKTLSMTDKYDNLKAIVIQEEENICEFNKNYKQLYKEISDELKPGIKVTDYLKSIRSRKEACRAVVYEGAETIEEACKAAEKVQRILEYEKSQEEQESDVYKKKSSYLPIGLPYEISKKKKDQQEQKTRFYNNKGYSGPKSSYNEKETIKPAVPIMGSKPKITCYRCNQEGHKGYQCPVDDESLLKLLMARMKMNKDKDNHLEDDQGKN